MESNPQSKSFEHSRTKLIHKTNFLNRIQICKSKTHNLFRFGLVFSTSMNYRLLRIHEDLLDLWKQVKSLKKCVSNQIHKTGISKVWSQIKTKRILNHDLFSKPRSKPFWSPGLWSWNGTNPWICNMNWRVYSLIRFPQPY